MVVPGLHTRSYMQTQSCDRSLSCLPAVTSDPLLCSRAGQRTPAAASFHRCMPDLGGPRMELACQSPCLPWER